MARHKGRRLKVNKLVLPAAVVSIIVVFVVAAAWYQFNIPSSKPPAPATQYFRIIGTVMPEYGVNESQQKDGTYYVIKAMGFNVTAVEGPAHGVSISWAGADSDEVDIKQGQWAWLEVISKYGLPVGPVVNGSTFQTQIQVASAEATGKVTLTVS
jgi:hypothetical protein